MADSSRTLEDEDRKRRPVGESNAGGEALVAVSGKVMLGGGVSLAFRCRKCQAGTSFEVMLDERPAVGPAWSVTLASIERLLHCPSAEMHGLPAATEAQLAALGELIVALRLELRALGCSHLGD